MYAKKMQLQKIFGLDSHTKPVEAKELPEAYSDDTSVGRLRTDILQMMLRMPKNRIDRYTLLTDLDEGLAASVIDLYVEECTQNLRDVHPDTQIRVNSKNLNIQKLGNEVLRKWGIANRCQPFIRGIALYGDVFYRLFFEGDHINHSYIVERPDSVKVVQDEYRITMGYSQAGVKFGTNNPKISEAYDYVHFANKSRVELLPYGTSILHNSYRSLRQMILSEDAVLLYRLMRHPDRIMHMIDTGDADEVDQRRILNRWYNDFRRRNYINPKESMYSHRHQTITPTEDIFIALGKNANTSLEKLPGSSNAFDVHDLHYWINKFFGEVRVPKAFMGFEGDINRAATLTSQSIRFARSVINLQNVFKQGIRELLQIEFAMRSTSEVDSTYAWWEPDGDFELEMAYTSGLAELDWINIMLQRSQYAETFKEYLDNPYIDVYQMLKYIFVDIYKLDEGDINSILRKTPSYPSMGETPGSPALTALATAKGKTGASEADRKAAEELLKLIPDSKFQEELYKYWQDVHNLKMSTKKTPATAMDNRAPGSKIIIP